MGKFFVFVVTLLILGSCNGAAKRSSDPSKTAHESPQLDTPMVWAGLSGTAPRFIDSGLDRGLGWAEYETLSIRKGLQQDGFYFKQEWMTPARIEHEIRSGSPICTWPVELKDPKTLFKTKPDRIYSLPLNLAGAESHRILFLKKKKTQFQAYFDQKGDLNIHKLLHDRSLKTVLIRDYDYGDLNDLISKRDSKGDQEVKPEYSGSVALLVIKQNRQLLEMLQADHFDYLLADSLEEADFTTSKINSAQFEAINYQTYRLTEIQDPRVRLLTVGCGIHPKTLELMPYLNRWIARTRSGMVRLANDRYKRMLENKFSTRGIDAGNLDDLSGGFNSGGGDYWYALQEKHFGLLRSPESQLNRLKSLSAEALLKTPLPEHHEPSRWYFEETEPGRFLLWKGNIDLRLPPWDSQLYESTQPFPTAFFADSLTQKELDSALARTQPKSGYPNFEAIPLGKLKNGSLTVFGNELREVDVSTLAKKWEEITELKLFEASYSASKVVLSRLPKKLKHLNLTSCHLSQLKLAEALSSLPLEVLDLTNSQVSGSELSALLKHARRGLQGLSLGFLRTSFTPEVIRSFKDRLFSLRSLNLRYNLLSERDVRAILESAGDQLNEVDLTHNLISPAFFSDWVQKKGKKLRALNLGGICFVDSRMRSISLSRHLTKLDFHRASLDAVRIAKIGWPEEIISIKLKENNLTGAQLSPIFSRLSSQVKALELKATQIKRDQIEALVREAKDKQVKTIDVLDLSSNGLSDEEIEPLLQASFEVKSLDLSANRIQNKGIEKLLRKFGPHLRAIDVSKNYISEVGVKALMENVRPGLEFLRLGDLLGLDLDALAVNLPRSVTELWLDGNLVSDSDLEKLAPKLPSSLQVLNLARASFGDLGALHLARSLPKGLVQLNLEGTPLSGLAIRSLLGEMSDSIKALAIEGSDGSEQNSGSPLAGLPPGLTQLRLVQAQFHYHLPETLSWLRLERLTLSEEAISSMGKSWPPGLRVLRFFEVPLGDQQFRTLFSSFPPSLERITFLRNLIGDPSVFELAKKDLSLVYSIVIDDNPISSRGLNAILSRGENLVGFGIHGSKTLDDHVFEGLSLDQMDRIRSAILLNSPVGDEGLLRLSSLLNPDIEALDISSTKLTPQGVEKLVKVLPPRLRILGIVGLEIGQKGQDLLKKHAAEQEEKTGIPLILFQ